MNNPPCQKMVYLAAKRRHSNTATEHEGRETALRSIRRRLALGQRSDVPSPQSQATAMVVAPLSLSPECQQLPAQPTSVFEGVASQPFRPSDSLQIIQHALDARGKALKLLSEGAYAEALQSLTHVFYNLKAVDNSASFLLSIEVLYYAAYCRLLLRQPSVCAELCTLLLSKMVGAPNGVSESDMLDWRARVLLQRSHAYSMMGDWDSTVASLLEARECCLACNSSSHKEALEAIHKALASAYRMTRGPSQACQGRQSGVEEWTDQQRVLAGRAMLPAASMCGTDAMHSQGVAGGVELMEEAELPVPMAYEGDAEGACESCVASSRMCGGDTKDSAESARTKAGPLVPLGPSGTLWDLNRQASIKSRRRRKTTAPAQAL